MAFDSDRGVLVIARQGSAEESKMWSRLTQSPGSASSQERLQKAIQRNDIVAIRQLLRTALHLVLDKAHVSVNDGGEEPLNFWWRSLIHHPKERGFSYRGGALHPGCLFYIWVRPEYRQYVHLTEALYPSVCVDSRLLELPSASSNLAGDTPVRPQGYEIGSPTPYAITPAGVSPAFVGTTEPMSLCALCGALYPIPLQTTTIACGHVSCISCMCLSVQRRSLSSLATPANLRCPHEGCAKLMTRQEVRQFSTYEGFLALEWNELKALLQQGAVQCPGCGFLFERLASDDLSDDPLRDKLTCISCHVAFCALCYTAPYHDGRPCRHGGDDGSAAPKCRYCDGPAQFTDPPVCDAPLCRSRGQQACTVPKPCGHHCHGSCGEQSCVECLEEDCPQRHPQHSADDFCVICFTDGLADAPCLQLECGHVFHKSCVEKKIEQRWPCARINFKFLQCPLCDKEMSHHLLAKPMAPVNKLREALEKRYVDRLKMEGMDECDALVNPQSAYYQQPLRFAADQFNYYQCSKCKRPYFGGLRRCQDVERDEPDKSDLICGGCCAGSAQCDRHGSHYLEWKCKYCCNTAVWFCWGTTHFCELCHSPPRKTVREECEGEERCPLKAMHPANGTEFALGCAMCRSRQNRVQRNE